MGSSSRPTELAIYIYLPLTAFNRRLSASLHSSCVKRHFKRARVLSMRLAEIMVSCTHISGPLHITEQTPYSS